MKLCDKEVGKIGFGTWGIGGGYWQKDYSKDKESIEILRYAYEKGFRLFDTAEMYGDGHSEELVGKALNEYEDVLIVSKVWSNHLRHDDLIKSAINSRKRLGIKSIDLYLIHWPNNRVPIEESIRAMEELIDSGVIRCMGVSNFDVKLLKDAMQSAKKYEIAVNEIEYNVFHKSPENDIIPFAKENKIEIIAYSPLAKGEVIYDSILKKIGEKYNKTSVQIALNYLLKNSIPIPKASNKKHIDEIMGSIDFQINEEDYEILKKL
ncbi:aldo/keto reductase, diketogulonate reductase [Caldisphaera lagunensis DSM 15908]|uniref:Aldo/keto reductase, diketogulonate reductase n=1 Tax=Caldisphaera lagunensis (strain DSM 15908 / JCM 11604 / ANMR 0165 / IC-154) TaxID=1056495 RepID=L0AA03_CALLD|nr:aldo/keto reductase [Caldisphaera lagunensis]AFZ70728.1 aldo/keto reductase, diketogulonate reductase [Caldisphaera lagunensis DSM 15908]